MNSPNIDSPLMTNAEAMAYCRIKDPRVAGRGYFPDFSRTQAARSYLTRRRCSRPISNARRIASCFAKLSAAQAVSRALFVDSLRRTGVGARSFPLFFKYSMKQGVLNPYTKAK